MRRTLVIIIAASTLATSSVQGQDKLHERHITEVSASNEASITITINPEARVSVSGVRESPSGLACGRPIELPVKIVNLAGVTSSLEASLVESAPAGSILEFPREPLIGTREELRVLRVTLKKPGLWDITIAFHTKNDIPDLGGRSRVHMLLQCF